MHSKVTIHEDSDYRVELEVDDGDKNVRVHAIHEGDETDESITVIVPLKTLARAVYTLKSAEKHTFEVED